jgi:hypothetical protein
VRSTRSRSTGRTNGSWQGMVQRLRGHPTGGRSPTSLRAESGSSPRPAGTGRRARQRMHAVRSASPLPLPGRRMERSSRSRRRPGSMSSTRAVERFGLCNAKRSTRARVFLSPQRPGAGSYPRAPPGSRCTSRSHLQMCQSRSSTVAASPISRLAPRALALQGQLSFDYLSSFAAFRRTPLLNPLTSCGV